MLKGTFLMLLNNTQRYELYLVSDCLLNVIGCVWNLARERVCYSSHVCNMVFGWGGGCMLCSVRRWSNYTVWVRQTCACMVCSENIDFPYYAMRDGYFGLG